MLGHIALDRVLAPGMFKPSSFIRRDGATAPTAVAVARAIEPFAELLRARLERVEPLYALRGRALTHRDTGPEVRSVGQRGEMTVRLLALVHHDDAQLGRVVHWAEAFGLPAMRAGWAGSAQLKITFQDPATGTALTADSAATGSWQALTLATQVLLTPPGSTLLLEEPENNLPPAYERLLPELFAESVASGHQIVLATHSEVLVVALANAVRRSVSGLRADRVAIYELDRDQPLVGARARRISVSSRGNLEEWVRSHAEVETKLHEDWLAEVPVEGHADRDRRAPARGRRNRAPARKDGRRT